MVSENYQQGINSPQKCNSCEEKCVNFYLKGAVEPFETFQQGFQLKISYIIIIKWKTVFCLKNMIDN